MELTIAYNKLMTFNKKYTYIRCNKLIIPLIDNYLKEINLEKNIIYVKNIGELNEN